MDFNIENITFKKLDILQINELIDFIWNVYQKEDIWLTYSKEQIANEIFSSFANINYRPVFYLALYENKIIGCGSWMWSHMSSNVVELSFGTVHPDFQRKGIGKRLTELRLEDIQKECNKDSVIVVTARRPEFFEKMNFKHSFNFKNENEKSYFMYCKVVDLPKNIIKKEEIIRTNKKWFH